MMPITHFIKAIIIKGNKKPNTNAWILQIKALERGLSVEKREPVRM